MIHELIQLVIWILLSKSVETLPKYYDVSIGKCDGSFSFIDGQSSLNTSSPEFIVEFRNITKLQCRWICSRETINCWMIEYFSSNNCRLFNKIEYMARFGTFGVDAWLCNDGTCTGMNNRCPGYWVGYDRFEINDRDHFPLHTYHNILLYECQKFCESSTMCGSLNFHCFPNINDRCTYFRGNCTLLYGFAPILRSIIAEKLFSDVISWRCCPEAKYVYQDSLCRKRQMGQDSVYGKWKLQDTNFTDLQSYSFYSKIFSSYSKVCVDICSNNAFCIQPVFVNGIISVCYLALSASIGNSMETNPLAEVVKKLDHQIWIWDVSECQSNNPESENPHKYLCYCFKNNANLTIYNEKCRKYESTIQNGTLSLYARQDYKTTSSLTDGKEIYVVPFDEQSMTLCDIFNCNFYNTIVNSLYKEPNIINRDDWFAVQPLSKHRLTLPVNLVIILNTYTPNGRCFKFETCSTFVREFQRFHMLSSGFDDIAYNFLIGEDGNVYEGRGWNRTGAHTRGYNSKSIGVAFIGWFEYVNPSDTALAVLRDLISYGIKKRFLSTNVILRNNRDLRPSEIPGKMLKNIVDRWTVSKFSVDQNCTEYVIGFPEFAKYLFALISVIFLILIMFLTISYSNHKMKCCRKMMIHIKSQNNKLECICEIISCTSTVKISLRKDWVYVCEERKSDSSACQCRANIGTLWTYCMMSVEKCFITRLHALLQMLNCQKKSLVFIMSSGNILEAKFIFIFHLPEEKCNLTDQLFKRIVSQKSCVCKEFTVTQYPLTTHRQFGRRFSSFTKTLSHQPGDEECLSTVKHTIDDIYKTKCHSNSNVNGSVNFCDLT